MKKQFWTNTRNKFSVLCKEALIRRSSVPRCANIYIFFCDERLVSGERSQFYTAVDPAFKDVHVCILFIFVRP